MHCSLEVFQSAGFSFTLSVTGKDLLVHPVTEEGARGVTAYLPGHGEVGASTMPSFSFQAFLLLLSNFSQYFMQSLKQT